MKKTKIFLILSILTVFSSKIFAADKWDKMDIVLGTAAASLTITDFLQTMYISEHPEKFYERNPILGEHPSNLEVGLYFGTVAIVGGAIAYYAPSKYRKWFLGSWGILELGTVLYNNSIGIGFSF